MNCKICNKEITTTEIDVDNLCLECRNKETKPNYLIGWECPRCRKIHSPYSKECNCQPAIKTYIVTNPYDNQKST